MASQHFDLRKYVSMLVRCFFFQSQIHPFSHPTRAFETALSCRAMQRKLLLAIGWTRFWIKLALVSADSCPTNPITATPCSADHYFLNAQGHLDWAGKCSAGGQCSCASDFKGKACEIPVVASATDVLMNSWAFLAKSCWSANAQGSLTVSIRYTPWNCTDQTLCRPLQNISSGSLPQIMFYSSYDSSFSQAMLQSYTANAMGTTNTDPGIDQPCFGSSAVYKETISCSSIVSTTVRGHFALDFSSRPDQLNAHTGSGPHESRCWRLSRICRVSMRVAAHDESVYLVPLCSHARDSRHHHHRAHPIPPCRWNLPAARR